MLKLFLLWISLLANSAFAANTSSNPDSLATASSLMMPKGIYSVGVKQYNIINTSLCPDPLFSIDSAWAFSNQNRCHQMRTIIYYPIAKNTTRSPYNTFVINAWQDDIKYKVGPTVQKDQLSSILASLNSIKSYTQNGGDIVSGNFPVIIFQPGFTYSSSDYENYITNLVSNGYIVVGIDAYHNTNMIIGSRELKAHEPSQPNNLFITGSNATLAQSDLKFMIDALKKMKAQAVDPVFQHMNLDKIGGLGHSLGAYSVYKNSLESGLLSAGVALDIVGGRDFSDYQPTANPFLFLRSSFGSQGELKIFNKKSQFNLGKNEYLVFMSPMLQTDNYSMHNSFQDLVTLQYNKAVLFDFELNKTKPHQVLGQVNGYTFTADVNQYLLVFFDNFLKNQQSIVFMNCKSPNKNSILFCNNSVMSLQF